MIYCTVLTGADRVPAETFIQATTRNVCLPDMSDSRLAVSVNRNAFMQIKIDEEVVLGVEVKPETSQFELAPILTRKKKAPSRLSLLSPFRRSEPDPEEGPARTFTVMFRDGGPNDRVVATYEFHLLEAQAFGSRYSSHLSLVDATVKPAKFTTDARSLDTARDCWNCETPVKSGGICRNCGSSQNGADNEG
ncbi:MAG: hypothetical protein SGJ27_27280 [Candidatus Melainabacteria bacterium]|nr:hypothetical protein [Candidatus Melainabacteria bacterium]